jgi:hypothetical protein
MVTVPRDAPAWAQRLADDITHDLAARGVRGYPVVLASFVKTDLPDAARWTRGWIYVTNDVGGAVPAFSDGVNWRRSTDRAVIS